MATYSEAELLQLADEAFKKGEGGSALEILRSNLSGDISFPFMCRLVKCLSPKSVDHKTPMGIALLGGGTLNLVSEMLRFWLALQDVEAHMYVPAYGTWRQEILTSSSELNQRKPSVVWLFSGWRDVEGLAQSSIEEAVAEQRSLWDRLRATHPTASIIQNLIDTPMERPFGNYEAMLASGRISWVRRYNNALAEAARDDGVFAFDYGHLAATHGLLRWQDDRYWLHSKHPFAPELTPAVSYSMARQLAALRGTSRKCLVLDLDNTLWGGVIGDDGLEGIKVGNDAGVVGEAFSSFQRYIKSLSDRGVVLAVCSKNELNAAREPFEKHPGMTLRESDFAVFCANWNNKADNIRDIAKALDLGLDSFVFVDDNPVERNLVRTELPMVVVPEMPEDPALYVRTLDSLSLFEMAAFSEEDRKRSRMYKDNATRNIAKSCATDINSYLAGLRMVAETGRLDPTRLPRMAQLVNKSNQFHPTTTRYTEAELHALSMRQDYEVRWFSLSDCYGDNGLIAVLVLHHNGDALVIDTWAMSCRVLARGMEEFILREISFLARERGCSSLLGVYKPTPKNGLVASLYGTLGFSLVEKLENGTHTWMLPLAPCREDRPLHIAKANMP